MHAAPSTLKLLDAVYHSSLRFITGDGFRTHHCTLYENVGWTSLYDRRERHCLLFVYKALLGKLPPYLTSLLNMKSICHNTRSQGFISLQTPQIKSEFGKLAFTFFASNKWNKFQELFKLDRFVSLDQFKGMIDDMAVVKCSCFD